MYNKIRKREMKNFRINLRNVAAIVACLAVSLMLFTGCEKDDPTPEPEGNGIAEIGKTYVSTTANIEKVYTLKVSKSLLRSSAAATDTYVLLYVDKSGEVKTSMGVVASSAGEALVLTPTGGTPFTVNVTADGITGISGNITFTDNSTATGGSLTPFANGEIEITGSTVNNQVQLDEDRVLGVPGMAVNYVYNGTGLLAVKGSKTLTILPGTTIRFTQAGGGIEVRSEATIKMLGEDKLRELDATGNLSTTPGTKSGHIILKGGATKGSWDGVYINSDKDNQFQYVDILNGGSRTDFQNSPAVISLSNGGKLSMIYSKISGSKCNGLSAGFQGSTIAAFDHNVIENCDKVPVYLYDLKLVAKFDATSELANNTLKYVQLPDFNLPENSELTINKTSVPYYVEDYGGELKSKLTVNAGVAFYMAETAYLAADYATGAGRLIINGTTEEPVTFTRLPGTTYYWRYIKFDKNRSHELKNVILEYGGGQDGVGVLDFGREASVTMQNVILRNSNTYGVTLFAVSTVAHNHSTVFANCKLGNVGLYYTHIGIVESVLNDLP
jgi:hypothetical protein